MEKSWFRRKSSMKKSYVLYNLYSNNGDGEKIVKESEVAKIENAIYVEIVEGLQEGDTVYAASKVSKKGNIDGK